MDIQKSEIEEILTYYDIGNVKEIKDKFTPGSTVYIIITSIGKYVLKNEENSDIEFQSKLTDYLSSKGVLTQTVMKTKNNDATFHYKNLNFALFTYIEGKTPELNQEFIKDYAQLTVKLHCLLKNIKLKQNNPDTEIGDQFRESDYIRTGVKNNEYLNNEYNKLLIDIQTVNKDKLRPLIIHADLGLWNLINYKGTIGIIDWGDAHNDYMVFDLAVIIHAIIHSDVKNWRELSHEFLEIYQKSIKLNNDEKKAMYYFVKSRFLGSYAWTLEKVTRHKDRSGEFMNNVKKCEKYYREFNKLSLNEFLTLVLA